MNRKILQAGPTTLAVSLPMAWVKKFKLKPGQELFVEQKGNSLSISTKSKVKESQATINVDELTPIANKVIGILYRCGYKKINASYLPKKEVNLRGRNIKQIDLIKETFDHLTGMQLWEVSKKQNKHYATTIEKADIQSQDFDINLNRLLFNVINQAKQVNEALEKGFSITEEVHLNERLINQTSDFCQRILNTVGYPEYNKTGVYYELISRLEGLGDRYIHLYLSCAKKKLNKSDLKKLKNNLSYVERLSQLYRKFDITKLIYLARDVLTDMKHFESEKEKVNKPLSFYCYNISTEVFDILDPLVSLNHKCFKDLL